MGIGLYGLIVQPHPLRKLVAFNIMGSGVFVLFGALAKRGAAAGLAADPVPQALLITAIVVAFAATAVTVALLLRLIEATGLGLAGRRAAGRRMACRRWRRTAWTVTDGGALLAAAVLLPFVGMLLGLVLGGRWLQRVAFALMPLGLALAVAIAVAWSDTDGPLVYLLGGWSPPLGIALRADGPAVAMLLAVAGVVCGIGLFARADFGTPRGRGRVARAFAYWLLLLAVWGALNLVFVSGDLFTLYVALELLTFAGVPLVCLAGSGETLRAALRYMLFALCGSVLYLLGAVLLYGGYGTLDIPLLADAVQPEPIAWAALALMTVGLLAKTALFPLHIWLPPAHGGAPAAASAVLSALVIKGSWFLVLRLWLDVMPGVASAVGRAAAGRPGRGGHRRRQRGRAAPAAAEAAGRLFDGGADRLPVPAVPAGLRRRRRHGAARRWRQSAGVLQAIAHATAKAGMFMAAGLIYAAPGPRPHRRPGRRGAGVAGGRAGLPGRRPGADGRAAQRRLPGEEAAAGLGR